MPALGHERIVDFEGLKKIARCANYVCSDGTFTAMFLSLDASISIRRPRLLHLQCYMVSRGR